MPLDVEKRTSLRWPTIFCGIVMSAIFSWITPWSNIVYQNSPLGGSHFPVASFGVLMLLSILWNGFLGRFWPGLKLYEEELLYIWLSITIAATLSYTGFARTFLLNIVWHPDGARKDFLSGLVVFGNDQLSKYILQGIQGADRMSVGEILGVISWKDWFPVLSFWGLFVIFVIVTLIGLASVFSHQWIENERLPLPLLYLPAVFSKEAERSSIVSRLKNGFFILGLMVPVFIHTINGLATYFPNIPQIPTLFLAQPYIPQEGILKGFAKLKIYIYPAFIGFAYLVPRQVSLSVWSFFLLSFLIPGLMGLFGMSIPNIALGTTFGPGVTRIEEMQMIGAYGVCAIFILWLSKYHIKGLIFDRSYLSKGIEYSGIIHPRIGLVLFVTGYILVAMWLVIAGVDKVVAVFFVAVCFMLQIVTAKMICQGGLPYFTLPVAPSDGFLAFIPTKILSPLSIYMSAVVQKMSFLDVRESILPTLIHGSGIAKNIALNRWRLLAGVAISILLSLFVSVICMLVIYHKYGALSLSDTWAIDTVSATHDKALSLVQHPETPKLWITFYVVIGAVVMTMLIWGYHRFVWWPLHPMGYLMAYNSATHIIWFSFFMGWMFNRLVFHYGGLKTYETVRWFFMGLIVGDVVMAIIWIIVGWFSSSAYHVFPT